MTSRLIKKDEYNKCCHDVRNAISCLGLAAKRLEMILGGINTDLETAGNLAQCVEILKRESIRAEIALSNSLQIWRDVAEELDQIESRK